MQFSDSGELVDTDTGEVTQVTGEITDERQEAWDNEMERLRFWNKVCGWLHLGQGGFMFIASLTFSKLKNSLIPITSLYQNWDTGAPVQNLGLVTEYNLVLFTSLFSLLAAAQHFTVLHYWDRYTSDLRKGM